MAPFGMNWPMFIIWLVAVPGMIILSWVLPETKWWKKIVAKYFEWTTE